LEIAVGWPVGMALSLFVVFADVLLAIDAARRNPHLIGPAAILAVLACLVLLVAVLRTTSPVLDDYSTKPDGFFGSANWLYWFSGVAVTSVALQGLFAFRYIRYLSRPTVVLRK
jgi:hypothetical protein